MSHYDKNMIKAAVAISEYLTDQGVKVSGRTRAVASWRGGKNPNVAFNDSKGTWKDFKTGDKGDIFDLFRLIEGGDLATAVKTLGERYAVQQVEGDAPSSLKRKPHAPTFRLTDAERAEAHRLLLPLNKRQFVPVFLRNYWKTSAAGHSTADIFAESIRMTDANIGLTDADYRRQAARHLRALYRPGDLIWAGSMCRKGDKVFKIPFDGRSLYSGGGVVEAFDLAKRIESGAVATIPTHISLNPVTGQPGETGGGTVSYNCKNTVARYCNALIEFDDLKDVDAQGLKIPSQDQIDVAAGLADYSFDNLDNPDKVRVVSCHWTGGKSIHTVLRVEACDLKDYERQLAAFAELFASADDPRFRVDLAPFKNHATLFRLAGAIRPETGRRARLLAVDERLATPDFSTPPCGSAGGRGLCGVCLHLGECPFASKTAVRGTTIPATIKG